MKYIDIKEFGPVKEARIDIDRKMQVIIGSQASGKSTICRVVCFSLKIRDYILDFLMQEEQFGKENPNNLSANCMKYLTSKFLECFGATRHMRKFQLEYHISEIKHIKMYLNDDGYIRFSLSNQVKKEIDHLINQARDFHEHLQDKNITDRMENRSYMRRQMLKELQNVFENDDRIIYVPAGRSLLATLSDHLIKISDVKTDLFMQEFCALIEDAKASFGLRIPEIQKKYTKTVSGQINNMALEEAYKLIKKILKADYVSENDGEKIYFDDYHFVRLLYASSGQHEALWILLLCYLTVLEKRGTMLVVEEPEAHLFPEAQRWMVELLSLTINSSDSKVIITTHSPYVLTSMNVLLLSHVVEKNVVQNSIVPKAFRLSGDETAAYRIDESTETNNILSSIFDPETNLIEAGYIDEISMRNNEDIDSLIEKGGLFDDM